MSYQLGTLLHGTQQKIVLIGQYIPRQSKTAIDIGCNEALVSAHLGNMGLKTKGIEGNQQYYKNGVKFIQSNHIENMVSLENKILTIDELMVIDSVDISVFLSVHHQIVKNNSLAYANDFLKKLYVKTKHRMFFSPCAIYEKYGQVMPFVENDIPSLLKYFTMVLGETNEPVFPQFIGVSQNGIPASEPYRPIFIFSKEGDFVNRTIPSQDMVTNKNINDCALININIDRSISARSLQSFSKNEGWHYFVSAAHEINELLGVKDAQLNYHSTALACYYNKINPKNFGELWNMSGKVEDIGVLRQMPLTHYCSWLPWEASPDAIENMKCGVTRCSMIPEWDAHAFGPKNTDDGVATIIRLHDILLNILKQGYAPSTSFDGYVRGIIMKDGEKSRFVVTAGQHRMGVLAAIGYRWITAKFQPGRSPVVDIDQIDDWPLVMNGIYTRDQAANIFQGIFNSTGLELKP